jgi:Mn2+/Fe2+ NRAMP family transporter
LIGSGLVAIPVLLVSTSYAVVGTADWPSGLSKRLSQARGFYFVLTSALVSGLGIALLEIDPIQLIFWANVIAAIMAPPLVIAILLIGNNRAIMKDQRLSLLHNIGLVLIILILIGAVTLLFYSMATGQSNN